MGLGRDNYYLKEADQALLDKILLIAKKLRTFLWPKMGKETMKTMT